MMTFTIVYITIAAATFLPLNLPMITMNPTTLDFTGDVISFINLIVIVFNLVILFLSFHDSPRNK